MGTGVKELVLAIPGVVFFAFGTSLPATLKRKSDVSMGEIYAWNTFTQLVVPATCALIAPIAVDPSLVSFAMPFLILASVIQFFVTSGYG